MPHDCPPYTAARRRLQTSSRALRGQAVERRCRRRGGFVPSPLALWNVHLRKRRPARLNDDTRPEAQPRARPSCERDQPPPAPPHRAEPTRASLELAAGQSIGRRLVLSLARNPGQQFLGALPARVSAALLLGVLAARGVPWRLTRWRRWWRPLPRASHPA